jgi:hypothetical protein
MPAEQYLLIYSLYLANDRQTIRLNNFLNTAVIDWDYFIKLVVCRHHVVGPVYKNLSQYCKALVPEPALNKLKKQYQKNAYLMMEKTAELVKLVGLFKKNGIRALPYKGPVLGMQLYGDICMRSSNDLDIVVPKNSIFQAEKILKKYGYKKLVPVYELSSKQRKTWIEKGVHSSFFNPVSKIKVELHWKFFSNHLCPVGFEEVWQNRQTIKIGENHLPACDLDDMLILLLIHGGKHCWRRLFWLNDIRLILSRYSSQDFKKLMDRAEQLEINRPVLSAMILLNTLYDFDLPRNIHEMAEKDKMIPFLVRMSIDHFMESDEDNKRVSFPFFNLKAMLSNFFLVSDIPYKIRFLLKILFPADFGYLALPDRFFFLYYLFRPFFWFFRKFTRVKPARVQKMANY